MKQLAILSIVWLALTLAAPEPNKSRQCAADKIVVTTTVLKDSSVDDSQLIYIEDTDIVYMKVTSAASLKSDVYRSSDTGKTWVKQTTSTILKEYNGEGIIGIFSAKANNKNEDRVTLYLLSYGSKMWVTTNGGQSYEYYNNVPAGVTRLITHDLYPGVALAKRANNFGQDSTLFLMTEFGKSWEKLMDVPAWSQAAWSTFSHINPQRIYVQMRKGAPSPYESHASVIVYSDDWFKTYKELPVQNVYYWYLIAPSRIVAITCVEPDSCAHKKMYISEDSGDSFHVSSFPDYLHETKNETGVFPYEVSDDVIWAYVNRHCQGLNKLCYGDLYHSYAADEEFTLSLRYVNPRDFTKYESLQGIYLANQYVTVDNEIESENDIRTLITFNKGGSWNVLQAPTRDSNNQPTNCFVNEGCSLHLHGYSDFDQYWDFFYSVPNAIGVMLASGNIGTVLADRADGVNLYYSRDGGMEWEEVRRGRYITEIGNHGTAILAAKIGTATNQFTYTLDDGDTWSDCVFETENIDVRNIRISTGWDSTEFILYGHKGNDAYVVHIDVNQAYSGKCAEGDFEIWSPKDEHGECVMGRHTQYKRRALGKKCFLDEEHIHATTISNCSCAVNDYECAECFYRETLQGQCQMRCTMGFDVPPPPPGFCDKSNSTHPIFYEVDMGYKLIDEDTCDPNLPGSIKPKSIISCETWKELYGPQPSIHMPSSKTFVYVLVFVAILLCIGGGSYYLWKTNDKFYTCISNTLGIKNEERDLSYAQVHGQTLVSSDDELTGVKEDKMQDELSDSSSA